VRNVNRKRLHGRGDRGHGFGMVAPRELRRSRGAASYYAWSARPGLRFISLESARAAAPTAASTIPSTAGWHATT
jgi:hypothetical protein